MLYNKELSLDEIKSNYESLLQIIELFKDNKDRYEKIIQLYTDLEEQIAMAPASSLKQFHGSYPGGYVVHILNVIKFSTKIYGFWESMGGRINDFTQEELVFSAMFHDLGKIGEKGTDYYIKNESEWHRENQGKLYNINPALKNMPHSERSLYMLQKYGITVSDNEYIAIRSHDGPGVDLNKTYWDPHFDKSRDFRNNLPIIIHMADFMAYRIEMEQEGILDFEN